jgi:hypothetical protein
VVELLASAQILGQGFDNCEFGTVAPELSCAYRFALAATLLFIWCAGPKAIGGRGFRGWAWCWRWWGIGSRFDPRAR